MGNKESVPDAQFGLAPRLYHPVTLPAVCLSTAPPSQALPSATNLRHEQFAGSGDHWTSVFATGEHLASQLSQPVTMPPVDDRTVPPQVLADATKLRLEQLPGSDDLWVFDFATGEHLYRLDEKIATDWTERMLVNARGEPIVRLQKELAGASDIFLHAPSNASAISNTTQHRAKLTSRRHGDKIEMELELVDATTGEKVAVFAKDKWELKTCTLALWLARGGDSDNHEPIGSITRTLDGGCDVEVAAGVDLSIPTLFAILLRDIVATHKSYERTIGVWTERATAICVLLEAATDREEEKSERTLQHRQQVQDARANVLPLSDREVHVFDDLVDEFWNADVAWSSPSVQRRLAPIAHVRPLHELKELYRTYVKGLDASRKSWDWLGTWRWETEWEWGVLHIEDN